MTRCRSSLKNEDKNTKDKNSVSGKKDYGNVRKFKALIQIIC